MAFREKLAWVTFVAVIVIYGGHILSLVEGGNIVLGTNTELLMAMIAFGIVVAIGSGLAALTSSKADRGTADERDQRITMRAERAQGMIVTVGAVLIFIYALIEGDRMTAHFLFFFLVAGELAKALFQIKLYRSGEA